MSLNGLRINYKTLLGRTEESLCNTHTTSWPVSAFEPGWNAIGSDYTGGLVRGTVLQPASIICVAIQWQSAAIVLS